MPSQSIHDKTGEPIEEGDHVYTKIRGGRHEGDVEKIVTSTAEAKKEGVKNPPKVGASSFFSSMVPNQKGKDVAHNPETLEVKEQPQEYESSKEVGA
ncbi:hypothetical protein SCAR479_05443 [Seiridium cardinale]|uniref:Hypervirulence associated protein TUDOR domain-containing protein n=1 Tax=Seiridium cardinale TaxID=138064 RepID=A0ABR2XW34_9PEZI